MTTTKLAQAKAPAKAAEERGVMTFTPLGETSPIKLSIAICRSLNLCRPTKSGAVPTDADIMKFMMLCSARLLNPFSGDVFFIGYDDNQLGPTFTLVAGVQTLHKRAELSEDYDGLEAGIVVADEDGQEVDIEGTLRPGNARLLGGWARVYRKNISRPFTARLPLAAYDTGRSQWKKMPENMIRKCALAAALREAFPNTNADIFLQEEASQVVDGSVVGAVKPATVSQLIGNAVPSQQVEDSLKAELMACASPTEALAVVQREVDANPPDESEILAVFKAVKAEKGWTP